MKQSIVALAILAASLLAFQSHAQDEDASKSKKRNELSISNKGIHISSTDTSKGKKAKKDDKGWVSHISMDLGVNMLQDNTNYNDAGVKNYLAVAAIKKNSSLFDLRQGKSINVNIYPWLKTYRALKTGGQRIYITTGLGLQIYNFRYDNNITYTRNPSSIIQDTISFSKNKVGLDYLNIPLMFTFKTKLFQNGSNSSKSTWLVYGVGITEGYAISTWTKQVSGQRGKVKMHDDFNFSKFNTCLTAEIGIDDVIRFYGSYQVTSLYNNNVDQHPIAFGIRFIGI